MAHILSKRAYLYIIIFFIAVFIVSLFASCGSDTVVNSTGNPPINTGLLSIDTFGIFNQHDAFIDTVLSSTTLSKTIKVEFKAETNCTIGDMITMGIKYKTWKNLNLTDTLNRSFSFTFSRDTSQITNTELDILLNTSQNNKYVRFVNFNVYKVD